MPTMHTLEDYSDLIKSYIDAKDSAKADVSSLGTAAAKDVPSSGNASTTQVVMGNDTRLSDSRNAKDVSSWAKASSKPTYNGSEIKTNAAKTGSGTTVTSTIAASTTMDNAIGTLLNNDVAENTTIQNLSNYVYDTGCFNKLRNIQYSQKYNSVDYTVNDDKTVLVNSDGTNNGTIIFRLNATLPLPVGVAYHMSGCPSGGSNVDGGYCLQARFEDSDGHLVQEVLEYGNGVDLPANVAGASRLIIAIAICGAHNTTTDKLFKPMVTPIDAPNSDYSHYVPYAETNLELTTQKNALVNNDKVNSAVNMLPYDLAAIKENNTTGTWSNNVYTLSNVQWTFADDGTVTAVTTGVVPNHSVVAYYIDKTGNSNLIGKTLRLTGCPNNGGAGIAEVQVYYPVIPNVVARDYGSGTNFLWNNDASTSTKATVNMVVRGGTASGKTFVFKPMLSVPELQLLYDNFATYAKSNRELTLDEGPEEIPFVKNQNLVGKASDFHIVRVGKNLIFRGYLQTIAATERLDVLLTLNTKYEIDATTDKDDNFYFTLISGAGATYTSRVNNSKEFKIDSTVTVPAGYYAVVGSAAIK